MWYDGFVEFVNGLWRGLPDVLKAILFLVLAFIVAAIVKKIVTTLIKRSKLGERLSKTDPDNPDRAITFIGRLVFLIVFLLFVPGIFGALGVDAVAAPILGMMNQIWGYLPNILGAVIVLFVGILIARLVRELLIPVFEKIRLDKLQEKTGVEVPDAHKLSRTLAYIIYVLILIPVIIIALQVLQIHAISEPAINMLNIIFSFIPNIIVAGLLIFLGVIIARFAGQIVSRLIGATGVDAKIQAAGGEHLKKFVLSTVVGIVVQVVIIIFFVVEAFNVLNLGVLTEIGRAIILYMPSVLAAIIIFVGAIFAASFVEKGLKNAGYPFYGLVAKIGITILAVFMILSQLNIAPDIIRIAFIAIMAAIAVAIAIAFGVGGREFAASVLKDFKARTDKMREEAEAYKAAKAEGEDAEAGEAAYTAKAAGETVDDDGVIADTVESISDAAEGALNNVADKIGGKIKGASQKKE